MRECSYRLRYNVPIFLLTWECWAGPEGWETGVGAGVRTWVDSPCSQWSLGVTGACLVHLLKKAAGTQA